MNKRMGMSKAEAKARIMAGEYTWDDLRRLLRITHAVLRGDAGKAPSRINRGFSLVTSFNIMWKGTADKSGPINLRGSILAATNILRDFGDSRIGRRLKPDVDVLHQDLIEIEPERTRPGE